MWPKHYIHYLDIIDSALQFRINFQDLASIFSLCHSEFICFQAYVAVFQMKIFVAHFCPEAAKDKLIDSTSI